MPDRTTEGLHPSAAGLSSAPPQDVLMRLLHAQTAAVCAIEPAVPALVMAADLAAKALSKGHRMAYAGAGSSGLMALCDCLELFGTFGIPLWQTPILFAGGSDALIHMTGAVEDDPAQAVADLDRVSFGAGDVVICVSASGSTPYTVAIAQGAKAQGAQVIGIACVDPSTLLGLADCPVFLNTGPEVVAGSTRMGAATAQKVALNMMSVLVAIRLGHVHQGYMVNVLADNSKLMNRAAMIVSALSGGDLDAARMALGRSEGAVKPAVLIARGADPARAAALLQSSGGHLSVALANFLDD